MIISPQRRVLLLLNERSCWGLETWSERAVRREKKKKRIIGTMFSEAWSDHGKHFKCQIGTWLSTDDMSRDLSVHGRLQWTNLKSYEWTG